MMKPRHELKHTITYSDYLALCARLRQVMRRDPFAGKNGEYKVRSLYFDNYRDKALTEKLIGVSRREKFRIRYYNDNPGFIRLEKKTKTRDLTVKTSCPVQAGEVEALVSRSGEGVQPGERVLLEELLIKMKTQQLRPKTVVDYMREAYILSAGNVRVTFDKGVRSGLYATELFAPDLPTVGLTPQGTMILEVKYDAFLPELICDLLQVGERSRASISKYMVCRMF